MSAPRNNLPSLGWSGLVRAMRDCCQRQEGEMCLQLALTASQFASLLAMPETGELQCSRGGPGHGSFSFPSQSSRGFVSAP